MNAIQSIMPIWVELYKMFKKIEIEDNSLTTQIITLDFCEVTYHFIKDRKFAKIRKGSFKPTYVEEHNNTCNKL